MGFSLFLSPRCVTYKERYANAPLDAPVHTLQRAEDLMIAVIGAPENTRHTFRLSARPSRLRGR